MCAIEHLAALWPGMYKNPRTKLATMAATLIETRSCKTTELAACLVPVRNDQDQV